MVNNNNNNRSIGPHVAAAVTSASTNVNVDITTEGSVIQTLISQAETQGTTPTWINTTTTIVASGGCGGGFPLQETPAGFNITGGPTTYGDKTIFLTETPTIVTVMTVPSNLTATITSPHATFLATPSGWTNEIDSPAGSSVTLGRIGLLTGMSVIGFVVITLAIFGNFIPLGPATKPLRERIAEWIRGHVRMLRG